MGKSVLLKLEKLNNARDLGGMKTEDGRKIRQGKLIRSEHLKELSDSDKKALSSLIDTVVDLRTFEETTVNPDLIPNGVDYIHIPILQSLTPGITPDEDTDDFLYSAMTSDPEKSKKYMCGMYASFASNDFSVSQYGKFIRLLTKSRDKAVLFHCTAGKDRAGTASLIIETLLGVSRKDIEADYLMTNEHLKGNIKIMTAASKKKANVTDINADRALWYLFAAEADYINAFYDSAEKRFGDFKAFAEKGLGLTEADIGLLKEIYLE